MPGPLPTYPITLTPEQEARLQSLSTCYTAPYAEVQRARLLLLAHHHPTWCNAAIARQVGFPGENAKFLAVEVWRGQSHKFNRTALPLHLNKSRR